MKVAIIKYNAGNTCSVDFALQRLGINALITDDAVQIATADKVILPGVGAAAIAMQYLEEQGLVGLIKNLKQPVLGICLGMQLLCSFSEEGNTECLAVFPQQVKKFLGDMKIPQVGWNNINELQTNLFKNVVADSYMYFVHSYYVPRSKETIGITNYNGSFSAAIQKDNFYAVQFHPEKSGAVGEQILKNFIEL